MSSFEKCLFRSFAHFLIGLFVCFWCLSCISFFNKFWILTLCKIYHWQICSPIKWAIFSLCWCFPLLCEIFRFNVAPFVYLSFVSLAQRDISEKNILLKEIPEIFLSKFSPRIFMVSNLTFEYLIHFEFILAHGVTWQSVGLFFFNVPVQFSQHHLLNGVVFHCMFLLPLSNINWP